MLERWLDGNVLQEAAESIWKGIYVLFQEYELFKSSRTKWPLAAGGERRRDDANAMVSALEGCLSERVKQLSYYRPSLGGV